MSSNRPLGRMLVSKAKNRTVEVDIDKVSLGSFYTTKSGWLTDQVRQFLENALSESNGNLLDPFAGDGHLLEAIKSDSVLGRIVSQATGFDIQGDAFPFNDSLVAIPNPQRAVIVTNPPYLANHSAKRKGVDQLVAKYFAGSSQKNLYRIALEKALESADYVVAIIPETFLLSTFPKHRLELTVVVQDSLFGDTDAPALVACFTKQSCADARIFTGNQSIGNLSEILALRESTALKHTIVFNDRNGRIGLRAVDGSDGKTPIAFVAAKDFEYPSNSVAVSSRLMTYLDLPNLSDSDIPRVISVANAELNRIRKTSGDLVLAPFKGNDRNGRRRRRLDYALARRILNHAAQKIAGKVSHGGN
jgi:hypothetical protein